MKRNLSTIEEEEEVSECFVELKRIIVIAFYSCFWGLDKKGEYYMLKEKKGEE